MSVLAQPSAHLRTPHRAPPASSMGTARLVAANTEAGGELYQHRHIDLLPFLFGQRVPKSSRSMGGWRGVQGLVKAARRTLGIGDRNHAASWSEKGDALVGHISGAEMLPSAKLAGGGGGAAARSCGGRARGRQRPALAPHRRPAGPVRRMERLPVNPIFPKLARAGGGRRSCCSRDLWRPAQVLAQVRRKAWHVTPSRAELRA